MRWGMPAKRDMEPLVSVIVTNYNHAAYLEQRMDTILAQTVADLELILLDDASTDGSADILRRFASDPRVAHLVVNDRNSGSAFRQWHKGIALARGKWVWIAESDDACAPEMLAKLLALNDREGDSLGIVYAQSGFINDRGERIGSMLRHTATFKPDPFKQDLVLDGNAFVIRYLKVKNIIPNASAVLVRRALLTDQAVWHGVMDMRLCGDWLIWTRLLAKTRIGFISEELNLFRHHAATTRELTTIQKRQRRLLEEVPVRSAMSRFPGIDQRREEAALYKAWFQYFTWTQLFSSRLFSIRIAGRSRLGFLLCFLSHKWATFKARTRSQGGPR